MRKTQVGYSSRSYTQKRRRRAPHHGARLLLPPHRGGVGSRLLRDYPPISATLLDNPAGHQAASHKQGTRAQSEQRRATSTTGLGQLGLRSLGRGRRRRRSRGGLRSRGRRGRRRGAGSLRNHATGVGRDHLIRTIGLGLGAPGRGGLGLGVGYYLGLVLGHGGRREGR